MAKVKVSMPDDLVRKISTLGDRTDEICGKALEAGADVVADKVKENLRAVVGKHTKVESRSTGELVSALGVSPVGLDKNNNYDIKIGFDEPRSDGTSNAKLANILEYGKTGQPAKPFLKPAKSSAKKTATNRMKQVFEEEISKL